MPTILSKLEAKSMALKCEKGLSSVIGCREPVAEQCLYCKKHFCPRHGDTDKLICHSIMCISKYKVDHKRYEREQYEKYRRTLGTDRNATQMCGYPECPNMYYIQCGHCQTYYCPNHVGKHKYAFTTKTRRTAVRVRDDIHLCDVCKPYLDEYNRDRYE